MKSPDKARTPLRLQVYGQRRVTLLMLPLWPMMTDRHPSRAWLDRGRPRANGGELSAATVIAGDLRIGAVVVPGFYDVAERRVMFAHCVCRMGKDVSRVPVPIRWKHTVYRMGSGRWTHRTGADAADWRACRSIP